MELPLDDCFGDLNLLEGLAGDFAQLPDEDYVQLLLHCHSDDALLDGMLDLLDLLDDLDHPVFTQGETAVVERY